MSKLQKKKDASPEYTKSFLGKKGLVSETIENSSPNFENMYIDYENDGYAIESFPGFRRLYDTGRKINGIFSKRLDSGNNLIIIHSGKGIYAFAEESRDDPDAIKKLGETNDRRSLAVSVGNKLYIFSGEMLEIDSTGVFRKISKKTMSADEGIAASIVSASLATLHDGCLAVYTEENGKYKIYFSEHSDALSYGGSVIECAKPIVSLASVDGKLVVCEKYEIHFYEKTVCGKYSLTASYESDERILSSCVFDGRIHFLGDRGLFTVNKTKDSDILVRISLSKKADHALIFEPLSSASLTVFGKYLVIFVGTRAYLADSVRAGEEGYEWFTLSGIGSYLGHRRRYKYAECADAPYEVSEKRGEYCYGEVYSEMAERDKLVYYEILGAKKYALHPTEEYIGGVLSPTCASLCVGENLYFGSEAGVVCIFNNDKAEITKSSFGVASKLLHPRYYSYDSHRVRYSIATPVEDFGVGNIEKESAKRSLAVEFKNFGNSRIGVIIESEHGKLDAGEICTGVLDFAELDFSGTVFSPENEGPIILPVKERNWQRKRVILESRDFCSPIGVYSINYRYKIKDNKVIKKGKNFERK